MQYPANKSFLDYNDINYSQGCVFNKKFFIQYFANNKLIFSGEKIVNFFVQHVDFSKTVQLVDLDTEKFYTEFTPNFQTCTFDENTNSLIIKGSDPKHSYEIIIQGSKNLE